MNPVAVMALAEYLTGDLVAFYFIAGSLPDSPPFHLSQRAQKFFKLREAFGVIGYMEKDEATRKIIKTLKKEAA